MQGQILADVRMLLDQYGAEAARSFLAGKEGEAAMKRLQGNQRFLLVTAVPRTRPAACALLDLPSRISRIHGTQHRPVDEIQSSNRFRDRKLSHGRLYWLSQFKRQLDRLSRLASSHPKIGALQSAVLEHFRLRVPEGKGGSGAAVPLEGTPQEPGMRAGRIIVFSSLRESVQEILGILQKHEPYIKARSGPVCTATALPDRQHAAFKAAPVTAGGLDLPPAHDAQRTMITSRLRAGLCDGQMPAGRSLVRARAAGTAMWASARRSSARCLLTSGQGPSIRWWRPASARRG